MARKKATTTSKIAATNEEPLVVAAETTPVDYALVVSDYGNIAVTGAVTNTKYVITGKGTWVDTRDLASVLSFTYQRFCTIRKEFVTTSPFREESPTAAQLAEKPKVS